MTRAPLIRIDASARSRRCTSVVIPTSPSLRARMISVPPPMNRAPRSDDSAAEASAGVATVLTLTGMAEQSLSCGLAQAPADRFQSRLIDLLADHFGQPPLFAARPSEAP